MDIPAYLPNVRDLSFVYGYDEFRQTLYLLLKTEYGRFLQSPAMGSRVAPHTIDGGLLQAGISATIEQLSGCSCESVVVSGDLVIVRVSYRGSLSDFEYSLGSF